MIVLQIKLIASEKQEGKFSFPFLRKACP